MAEKAKKGSMSQALLNRMIGKSEIDSEPDPTVPEEVSASTEEQVTVTESSNEPAMPAVQEENTTLPEDDVEVEVIAPAIPKKGNHARAEKRSAATYNVRPSQSEALKKIAFVTKRSISDVVEEAFSKIIAENEEKIAKFDKLREMLES